MTRILPSGRNRRSRLARTMAVGVTAAALLLTTACQSAVSQGGGGDKGAQATQITVATPATPDPSALLRRTGDTPSWINLVFDRLVDIDQETYQPKPWLAESWKWSDDGLTLTLDLRDDVKFHSGREFGPSDVIFTLNAAKDPAAGSQVSSILERIASMEQTGDHEVQITLSKPTSNLFDALMFLPVVDEETYAGAASGDKVIGTGPFTWEKYSAGKQLDLKANKAYWGGTPPLKNVTLRAIDNSQALLAALQSDQVQLIGSVPGRDLKALAGDDRYVLQSTESSYQQTYLGVDITAAPFDKVEVRQALQYAVDRQRIVDQVYGGFGNVSSLPWPAKTPGVTKDQANHYSHDVAKAKELLAKAGATGAAIKLFAANTPIFTSIVDIVQFDLTEAGFKVSVELLDPPAFQERVRSGNLPGVSIANVGLVSVSPETGVSTAAPLRPGKNTSHMLDPVYGELVDKALTSTDPDEKSKVVNELSDFFLEQSFHITLAQAFETYAMSSKVKDLDTSYLAYIKLAKTTVGK